MGLFDFLKSNKNIITDNGTNYIYFDNGKGSIKEKFNKIQGVLNGEYLKYNRNGTFNVKTYIDGVITLTEEEILIKNREEEINKNIKVEISKLKFMDDLISEISGIFLLVQMENSKIDYYSKLIVNRFNNKLDEDYIKFYLYTKRNYFIKQLIEYDLASTNETGDSLNDINTTNYYNKSFTEHIVNYSDDYLNFRNKRGFIKINYSDSYFVKSNILSKLYINFKVTCKINISNNGKGIIKEIFNQQSKLFGLNLNAYKLIFELIEKKSDEFKYDIHDKDNIETNEYLHEMLRGDESVINNVIKRKPDQMDKYAQKIVYEILSLCNNNKVNQNDILL